MTFVKSPTFFSARSSGAAGLLVIVIGCGTKPTPPSEPPPLETSKTRPTDGSSATATTESKAVGTKAPAFALKDQAGKERTLEDFLKQGKVALGSSRSNHRCLRGPSVAAARAVCWIAGSLRNKH